MHDADVSLVVRRSIVLTRTERQKQLSVYM